MLAGTWRRLRPMHCSTVFDELLECSVGCNRRLVVCTNDVAGITTAVSKAALQGKTVSFHLRVPGSVSGASPWGPLVNDGPGVKLVDEAAR